MIKGILGKKLGMTQIFDKDGRWIPVTVVEAGPCTIQSIKAEERDGYSAVQIGFEDTKDKRVNKPQREYLKSKGLKVKKCVREIRCDQTSEVSIGDEITNKMFQKGDMLDVSGVSKGKGFQGGMKRHNWSGGQATHGSNSHRAPGSIGASSYPSRVFKGQNMPGHMGSQQVTVQNLEVVEVNEEDNTILIHGAVPGANGTYLLMKYAKKKPIAERIVPKEESPAEEEVQTEEEKKEETQPETK